MIRIETFDRVSEILEGVEVSDDEIYEIVDYILDNFEPKV